MALETLLIKQLSEISGNINSVIASTDLRLLGIHNDQEELLITLINNASCKLLLTNVKTFAWQEDNYSQEDYRLLIVDKSNEILYCSIVIETSDSGYPSLKSKNLAKWSLHNIFRYFQAIAKSFENGCKIELLKFEAKEAVCLFDGKVVVSFFPSCENDPQIMSVSDLRDESLSHRKVLLSKEMLFALNDNGTKLSIFSFANNTKMIDFEFFNGHMKQAEIGSVINFTINLKLDLLVLITEKQLVFTLPLDIPNHLSQIKNPHVIRSVTAFAKQFPSVKRLNEGLRRFSTSSGSSQSMSFSCDADDLLLKELIISGNKLCFLRQDDCQSLVGIHLLDSDQPTKYKRFSHKAFIIKSGSEEVPFPLLLLSENNIYLLLYDIEQDKLVNELMIYPSSGTVEALSSLNNWVNIHMDIEVLKLGLSNRQLYTVEFFLKTLYEGFCQQWNLPFSLQWLEKVDKECSLWDRILNLVLENVCKNLSDNFSCQYAEQLLQVVISMTIQIMTVIENRETADDIFTDETKDRFLKAFSKVLLQTRKLLRQYDSENEDVSDKEDNAKISHTKNETILNMWKQWEKLNPEEVIQNSIINGMIPMAQSFFSCYCQDNSKCSFLEFERIAENLIVDYLRQGMMDKTLSVLVNMGIKINERLIAIFKSTSEKDIRILLIKELMARNLLNDQDLQSLKFVSLLEKLYPCTSFEHARLLLEEKSVLFENLICAVPENEESLVVGDFKDFNQDNNENGAYCRLVVNWLSAWDSDTKDRILAHHYLKNSQVLEYSIKEEGLNEINKTSVWFYLLENGSVQYLLNWIDIWLGVHPQNSDSFSVLDKWPISKEMIDAIPEKATTCVSETILNALAIHGIFCEEELEDISLFLIRIGRAQCDINDISIFSSEKSSISFSELCHRLVHYSLKHNLIHFLYTFISINYNKFSSWPSCPLCQIPILNLAISFYLWSQNHIDSSLAYDAVVETAQYIFNLPNITPTVLLTKIPLELSLPILLFKPQSLKETINSVMQGPEQTVRCIKSKFQNYPLLFNHLFKTEEEQSQPDVTIYELLKDSTVFDTSQLFGWQSTNSLKSEDSQNELPHFSLQSLSEQYGLKKELTYLYYLMEGRPNYSYLKFIAQEVILETGLSLSRVRSTCRDVSEYALINYKSSDICASCISLIELLGQDSLSLRACLIGANMLHDSRIADVDSNYNKSYPDIGRKFKQAYQDKALAMSLISELENVTLNKWNPFNTDSDSLFKDIILWMPTMIISHLYEVEAGNHYLTECAKQNDWLKFLVFAQVFQVPKEQVLKTASRFSNSCISYHIFHSLHRKSSLLYDVAYETKVVTTLKTQKKDMRKSLYSRIGVIKGSPVAETKKSPDLEDDKISVTSEETSSSSDVDLRSYVLKDLFSQLLLAHGSEAPWDCLLHTSYDIQNPVLAVLAASYAEAPLDTCFFVWLYTNLSHCETVQKQLETSFPNLNLTTCSTDDLEALIVLAIQNNKILTLWQGTHLFLADTPLPELMGFLRSFLIYKKFDCSIESFRNLLWEYPKSSENSSVLHSVFWIENISLIILKEAVIGCSSNYERQLLLRHFSHTKLENSFSKEVVVPQFIKVYKIEQCLGEYAHDIDVKNLFLPDNDPCYKNTCWVAIKKLLQAHLYEEAQLLSDHAKLPQDQMLLLQVNQEADEARLIQSWENLSYRIHFWQNIVLKLQVLPLHAAIDFLEVQCEISDMYGEKYFLVKSVVDIVIDSAKKGLVEGNIYNLGTLYKKMWWYCIKAEVNQQLLPEIFDVKPVLQLDLQDEYLTNGTNSDTNAVIGEEEKKALESIIGCFLSKSDVYSAFQLASVFKYDCIDLQTVKTCFELARGEIDVNTVEVSNIPDYSLDIASSRVVQSLVLWTTTDTSYFTSSQKSVVQCMKNLSGKCVIAANICYQILVQYVVSVVLGVDYMTVSQENDPFVILKKVLILKLNDQHILAKSVIVVRELGDKEVSRFLSEEIYNSLKILCNPDLVVIPDEKDAFSDQVIYDPLRTNEGFQLIVKLCQDPSVLGNALMSIFNVESNELNAKSSDSDFMILVDLCISAHECFTAACNMDGISQILYSAQSLVTLLEEAENFTIMVHLLTGLGRYSEMMYVFDILKSHDKFNILFDKKMDYVPNLKLALLDYLKKWPPSEGDNYFYTLANRFGMYREKAELLEMSVQKQLSQLCKRNAALDNEMKDELENALHILSEAAKSYCKADCLHQAQNCTRLAQLVALQIYFVPYGVWIIGLDESSVARFITDHDKFSQAYIVAEEYGNHHLWSQALLHNVVIRGDREYLREFQGHFGLPASLISDVVKRYKKLSNKNENTTRNMKLLLSLCTNVKAKYSLAHEMGFSDIISELLMGEGSSYLQDLIANNIIK